MSHLDLDYHSTFHYFLPITNSFHYEKAARQLRLLVDQWELKYKSCQTEHQDIWLRSSESIISILFSCERSKAE